MALIVVLWIFIFLFVVAFDFSASVREEAAATHRFSDETQGYYLAVAGFERGLYDFIQQARGGNPQLPILKKSDLFDGSWREEKLGAACFASGWSTRAAKSISIASMKRFYAGYLPILGWTARRRIFSSIRSWTGAIPTICTAPTAPKANIMVHCHRPMRQRTVPSIASRISCGFAV